MVHKSKLPDISLDRKGICNDYFLSFAISLINVKMFSTYSNALNWIPQGKASKFSALLFCRIDTSRIHWKFLSTALVLHKINTWNIA